MIDQSLRTTTKSGIQVEGRILGNELSDMLLVCSHGFGVKSDSHGMFKVICEKFQEQYLTVRFHYVAIDDLTNSTHVTSYSQQVEKLETVVEKLLEKYGKKKVIILGHSQGCLITALFAQKTAIELHQLILLAPSPSTDIIAKMEKTFGTRPGSELNYDGTSVVSRSDGSKTYIAKDFWDDARETNPLEEFRKITKTHNVVFVRATQDTIVTDEINNNLLAIPNIKYYELPNGHDFKEDNYLGLLKLLGELLEK